MEEKKFDVDAVIQRLEDYVSAERDIDNEIERLEHLNSRMTSTSAKALTGMPRSSNASTDRMADMLARKEELESSIRIAVTKQAEERRQLEDIIRHLRNADERAVIRMKYLDRTDWDEILEIMFGWKDDFDDRYESYKRRMFRIRKSAIEHMAQYIESIDHQNTAIPAT